MIEITTWEYIVIFSFIFLGGLLDSIAGGGGLISLPVYLFAGLPPHLALGTNKFSSFCGTLFATGNYFKNKLIDIKIAFMSALGALLGSWLGTRTVLLINPYFLNYLLVILIPVIALFTILNQKLGLQNNSHHNHPVRKYGLGILAGLVIGFYDGFFGPGTGTFLILFYAIILHYDYSIANGNTKVVNLSSNLAALITFAYFGSIYYPVAIPAAFFGIAGNLLGSKLVILRGNKLIRKIFIIALSLLMIRILFNIFNS